MSLYKGKNLYLLEYRKDFDRCAKCFGINPELLERLVVKALVV